MKICPSIAGARSVVTEMEVAVRTDISVYLMSDFYLFS
jgi:hypothetical protein